MRELENSLQQFGEFILKAHLVKEEAAPYCVRWVRRFLTRPASDEPLADQVRRFCESLRRERNPRVLQILANRLRNPCRTQTTQKRRPRRTSHCLRKLLRVT